MKKYDFMNGDHIENYEKFIGKNEIGAIIKELKVNKTTGYENWNSDIIKKYV